MKKFVIFALLLTALIAPTVVLAQEGYPVDEGYPVATPPPVPPDNMEPIPDNAVCVKHDVLGICIEWRIPQAPEPPTQTTVYTKAVQIVRVTLQQLLDAVVAAFQIR